MCLTGGPAGCQRRPRLLQTMRPQRARRALRTGSPPSCSSHRMERPERETKQDGDRLTVRTALPGGSAGTTSDLETGQASEESILRAAYRPDSDSGKGERLWAKQNSKAVAGMMPLPVWEAAITYAIQFTPRR